MTDLTTRYLGMNLSNPVVVSASPLQREFDNVRRMEDAGAAAVVMHSLFEEQIDLESHELHRRLDHGTECFAESLNYFPEMDSYNLGPEKYLEHLARVKQAVGIPVIGSLNGVSDNGWTRYARLMEQAGADAIELNIYYMATDPAVPGAAIEQMYCDVVAATKSCVQIPLAVKIGATFSSMANMAQRLDRAGADALVLFNRFYQPDFDLESLEIVPHLVLSQSYELLPRLSWIALLYGHIDADLAVTGGVHTGVDVVKSMMAGARVAMMTSALLENGIGHIAKVLAEVRAWLEKHEYESIRQMQGSMARRAVTNPAVFERVNYMHMLNSYILKEPLR